MTILIEKMIVWVFVNYCLIDQNDSLNFFSLFTQVEIFQSTTLLVINVFENEEVQRISNQFCVERGWNIEDDRCQSVRNSLLEEEHRMRTRGDGGAGARGAIRYNLILENFPWMLSHLSYEFFRTLMHLNMFVPFRDMLSNNSSCSSP